MIEINNLMKALEKLPDSGKQMLFNEMLGSVSVINRSVPGFKELEKAQNIINQSDENPSLYTEMPYLITTRNQKYLDKTLPENAESACVILSAGDTLFELVSRDIKKIVALDTNDLQTMIYKLRRASILTLSAKDFENFLICTNNYKFMSPEVFKTVKEGFNKVDVAAINFWEQLLTINPKEDLIKYFFKGVGGDASKTLNALPFVKRKVSYYELREKLENADISIRIEDALDYFSKNPEAKFDYIDIANILLFIYQLGCKDDQEKFKEKLKVLIAIYNNNLNNDGTFVMDHFFGITIEDLNAPSTDKVNEYIKGIYKITYDYLNACFPLESVNISKLIDGFGEKQDTILLTRKLAK